MNNLEKYSLLKIDRKEADFGTLTTLRTPIGIATHGAIRFEDKTILANYIYNKNSYDLVYTIIDSEGNVVDSFIENAGILPTLFESPESETYVSVIPYHPDKELEISIPLFDRSQIEMPKPNRPFTGKYIGNANKSAIFHDVDIWSEKKQDKILNIEFKDGRIKKKHNIKIDFPKGNKIYIKHNEIHLIARESGLFIHRKIDEFGKVSNSRKINRKEFYFREILKLSFNEISQILSDEDGKFILLSIDDKGNLLPDELIDIKDEIFNTWPAIEISEETFVIQFNTEFGDGWLTLQQGKLIEAFYDKGRAGYKNLLNDEVIATGHQNLIISRINKAKYNSYAVTFYPVTDKNVKNKELTILNRAIR